MTSHSKPTQTACLPGEPYAGNEAGTQIDHPSIDSREVRVWVEQATKHKTEGC
jgi:hypothetical protein